ncbi:MAG: chemotaxis protein CheW [Armatimonadetes bacterium]|nr:chemotaxis protein CheW [Armatimonadota bacterium]
MRRARRWLLVETAGRLFAAPVEQVRAVQEAPAGCGQAPLAGAGSREAPEARACALAERLGIGRSPGTGILIRVQGESDAACLTVDSVREIVEGAPLLPLPALLQRTLPAGSAVAGALLWRGELVLVLDLARAVSR